MANYKFSISTNSSRIMRTVLLAFSWVAGMLLGFSCAGMAGFNSSLVRAAVCSSVSTVGLFTVLLLPLILSAIAVYFSVPLMFLPLAFLKAFGFSYCSFQILAAFGSAGWLVRCLLLFSDSCICAVLLWFWIRNICGIGSASRRDLTVCAALALVVGTIDYFVVSPFLGTLFQ